jgi:hypothetical protein
MVVVTSPLDTDLSRETFAFQVAMKTSDSEVQLKLVADPNQSA